MPAIIRQGLPTTLPGSDNQTTFDEAGVDAALARGLRSTPQLPTSLGITDIYVPASFLNGNAPQTPNQIPDNLSGAGAPVPLVMGETRTVCLPFYVKHEFGYFNFMYLVCEGEIESYQSLYVDGISTDVSGQTVGASFTVSALDTSARCVLYTGTAVQDVSTVVSTFITAYTDSLENFAVLFLRLPAAVVQRAPRVEVHVEGKKIKDYTNGAAVGYTNNLGNLLIHWIEIVEGRTVDSTSATALANACAEDVGNGTLRRVGGLAITKQAETSAMRQVLRAHAAAHILDTGSVVYFVADRPADSVMDIGQDQIIGDVSIQGPSLRNQPVDVVIHWYNHVTGLNQTARATDTITGQVSEVRMPGINSAGQAKREAIERYNHLTLEGDVITFTMGPRGVELEPGDVVRLSDARVGISDKPYRLLRCSIPQVGLWRWTAREYQPNVYSDTVQGDPEIPDTNLTNPVPTTPTMSAFLVEERTSASVDFGRPAAAISNPDDTQTRYEFQLSDAQLSGNAFNDTWDSKILFTNGSSFLWDAELSSLESTFYRLRCRAIGWSGLKSDWVESGDLGTP